MVVASYRGRQSFLICTRLLRARSVIGHHCSELRTTGPFKRTPESVPGYSALSGRTKSRTGILHLFYVHGSRSLSSSSRQSISFRLGQSARIESLAVGGEEHGGVWSRPDLGNQEYVPSLWSEDGVRIATSTRSSKHRVYSPWATPHRPWDVSCSSSRYGRWCAYQDVISYPSSWRGVTPPLLGGEGWIYRPSPRPTLPWMPLHESSSFLLAIKGKK
ncbi:hypothetical protein VTK73DRAFT_8796 [Phialemonium thermophilum]|uniref:Uncharacterized protein n=1 Tax=Phialemonium thermophilum TaxID=223376 RepID=A0ABR3W6C8_9PEZI